MKRFQLMQRVNVEGLYGAVQAALPHLNGGRRPHRGRVSADLQPVLPRQDGARVSCDGAVHPQGPSHAKDLRKPHLLGRILAMLRTPAPVINGQLELDEDFLRKQAGVTDFSKSPSSLGRLPEDHAS
ncbi:91887d79-4fae-4332-ad45-4dda3de78cbf [Thermothielavioides terrestris]|uniref:91887d79-4fae-4332-ad45-4dda3de78cbf n=1 Tax=Thermothielavioides terrestris TaxID=2587410 RepID=A0A446BIG6_9PEZI|nr:91887d79-4fae-4332-ad45-4dda3de78cbf [Thermothielavioides terrestris]